MFARYIAPPFVPNSTNTVYDNPDISYTALQSAYLNWIKTVIESIGIFTRVELRTDSTTAERLMPANKDEWYEIHNGPLAQDYEYYIDCYIEDNLFFSIFSKTYKYQDTKAKRVIDGVTYENVEVCDVIGFIVKPKNVDVPSYHSVYYPSHSNSYNATNNILTYDGIQRPYGTDPSSMISSDVSSRLAEIVRTDDALFFRFDSNKYADYYSLCLSRTFTGSIAVVSSYSNYNQVAANGYSLFCISNESENYASIRSIPLNLVAEGSSTVLSYIPVACTDDYLIGTYYTPLSQIQFEDRASSCFIKVAGNKYFYTGFFAAPCK